MKYPDFKTICFKKNKKIPRRKIKARITKNDQKDNDKDEMGNILLRHVFTSL